MVNCFKARVNALDVAGALRDSHSARPGRHPHCGPLPKPNVFRYEFESNACVRLYFSYVTSLHAARRQRAHMRVGDLGSIFLTSTHPKGQIVLSPFTGKDVALSRELRAAREVLARTS